MNRRTTWPAKLLLFGEYSILLGSQALSMPLSAFGAGFRYLSPEQPDLQVATESNRQLGELLDFLHRRLLNSSDHVQSGIRDPEDFFSGC